MAFSDQPPFSVPADLQRGTAIPAIPADQINAGVWAARQLAKRGGYSKSPIAFGGGSGSGEALTWVRVYDDLLGYTPSGLTVTPATVRCLPMTPDGNVWTVQTGGDFINAVPVGSAAITLSDSGCCSTSSSTPTGLTINTPIGTGNRIEAADDDAVVVTGFGVATDSTVEVTAWRQDTSQIATAAATVDDNGAWTATLDLSPAADLSFIRVGARETLLDTTAQAWRYVAITKDDQSTATPQAEPMFFDDEDGRTSNNVVSVRISLTGLAPSATGPAYQLFVNGETFGAESNASPFQSELSLNVPITLPAPGTHSIQWALIDDPTGVRSYGGVSNPIYVTYDTSAPADPANDRYFRFGLVTKINGVDVLVDLDKCRYPLEQEEIDKLDA